MRRAACAIQRLDMLEPEDLAEQSSACFIRKGRAQGADRHRAGHAALPQGARLEESAGSCFALQLGKCRGACAGKEPLILHAMRLKLALSVAEDQSWPFPGRIALRERASGAFLADGTRGGEFACARSTGCIWDRRAARRNSRAWARVRHARIRCRCVQDPACAISRIIRSSNGMTCAPPTPQRRALTARVNDNVRYWMATAPVGAASVLAEELAAVRRRGHSRAQPRC